jgi:serine/threonine protein kinase
MLGKGTVLEGYRIDGVIGQGGMGVVYSATQLSLDRTVALKVLAESLSQDDSFRERFRREGMLQAALDHPHIVTVYEAGESEQGLFLAMRLVRGPNLKDLIVARELDAMRSIRLLGQVAGALDAAHRSGLVHRDIKPQNILVGDNDHAYLADFGLTKAAGTPGLTRTGQFVGSLDYIPPEQIRGETSTASGDTYALAAVLYECLTGVVPYPKESDAAVLYAHLSDPPPLVTAQRPELPTVLDAVIARAMSKNPGERHASASELVEAAERALETLLPDLEAPPPAESPAQAGIRVPAAPTVASPTAEAAVANRDPVLEEELAEAPLDDLETASPTVGGAEPDLETPPVPAESDAGEPSADERQEDAKEVVSPSAPETVAAQAALTAPAIAAPTSPAGPAKTFDERDDVPARIGRRRHLRHWLVAAAALVAVAALGAAGYAVAGSSGGNPTTMQTSTQRAPKLVSESSAGLGVSFLDTWRRSEGDPAIPGIEAADAVVLEPVANAGEAGLVAALLDSTGPTLLPNELLERLDRRPQGEGVRLGEFDAYRYSELAPEGFDGQLSVFAAPTTNGVATIACWSRGALDEIAADCDRISASLTLAEGDPVAIGPSEGLARALNRALRPLENARAAGRRKLADADTPRAQAAAAADIAAAFALAARKAARTNASPEVERARDALVVALEQAGRAYRDLASAARRNNERAFKEARRRVEGRERTIDRALASFAQLGYGTT